MKKSILAIALIALTAVSCKTEKKEKPSNEEKVAQTVVAEEKVADTGNVDISASILTWKGTKPTGAHNGTVALKSGSLIVENGAVKSGEFVVDMATIKCLDLEGEKAQNLVGHLTSADFFDVAKYSTSKFIIKSSEAKEGKVMVTGDLTVKDVTKSIMIPATVSEAEGIVTFKSDVFKINRAEFNIKYKSKSFFDNLKDKFIDDMVEMSFEVKAKK